MTVDPQPITVPISRAILALNNAHAAELSLLDARQLRSLVQQSFHARRIGTADAFLLALDETARYDSPNYLWFHEQYSRFIYVDRVVVAPAMRGRGYARVLYSDLFECARRSNHNLVVCEVNRVPPNPASDAFHATMEFAEVGQGTIHNGSKIVRYLARSI